MRKDEKKVTLQPKEWLFHEGQKGGDLYFIDEGIVEIVTKKDGQYVALTEMGAGEVIGVMTCLTSAPRMASARAKTSIRCRMVGHEQITKAMAKTPKWLHTIIKEYDIRLSQMNEHFSESVIDNRKLSRNQVSNLFVSKQVASTLLTVGPLMAQAKGGNHWVYVDDMRVKLIDCLALPPSRIEAVLQIFLASGLLHEDVEGQGRARVFNLDTIMPLRSYCKFLDDVRRGKKRKLATARFSRKEFRVMSGVVQLSRECQYDQKSECVLTIAQLEQMEKMIRTKFDIDALKRGDKLGLLKVEKDKGTARVIFTPASLDWTIACLRAYSQLQLMVSDV